MLGKHGMVWTTLFANALDIQLTKLRLWIYSLTRMVNRIEVEHHHRPPWRIIWHLRKLKAKRFKFTGIVKSPPWVSEVYVNIWWKNRNLWACKCTCVGSYQGIIETPWRFSRQFKSMEPVRWLLLIQPALSQFLAPGANSTESHESVSSDSTVIANVTQPIFGGCVGCFRALLQDERRLLDPKRRFPPRLTSLIMGLFSNKSWISSHRFFGHWG